MILPSVRINVIYRIKKKCDMTISCEPTRIKPELIRCSRMWYDATRWQSDVIRNNTVVRENQYDCDTMRWEPIRTRANQYEPLRTREIQYDVARSPVKISTYFPAQQYGVSNGHLFHIFWYQKIISDIGKKFLISENRMSDIGKDFSISGYQKTIFRYQKLISGYRKMFYIEKFFFSKSGFPISEIIFWYQEVWNKCPFDTSYSNACQCESTANW